MSQKNPFGPKRVDRKVVLRGLKIAKATIETESCWIKGMSMGRKEGNAPIERAGIDNANCFCAIGAVQVARASIYPLVQRSKQRGLLYMKMCNALCDALPKSALKDNIAGFNDRPATSHKQIMNLFDRAIKGLSEG